MNYTKFLIKITKDDLATVAQLVGVLSSRQKGHEFDFRSGHMPGLQVWSLVGVHMRCNDCIALPLSLSFPSLLSKSMCMSSGEDIKKFLNLQCTEKM